MEQQVRPQASILTRFKGQLDELKVEVTSREREEHLAVLHWYRRQSSLWRQSSGSGHYSARVPILQERLSQAMNKGLTWMTNYPNRNQRFLWRKFERLKNELRRPTSRECSFLSCFLLVLLTSLGACSAVFDDSHSSDAALIRNFELHQQDFDKVIEMAKVDSHVVRIAYDFTWLDTNYHWPRPESEIGLTKERWNEYKGMFSKLGLKEG